MVARSRTKPSHLSGVAPSPDGSRGVLGEALGHQPPFGPGGPWTQHGCRCVLRAWRRSDIRTEEPSPHLGGTGARPWPEVPRYGSGQRASPHWPPAGAGEGPARVTSRPSRKHAPHSTQHRVPGDGQRWATREASDHPPPPQADPRWLCAETQGEAPPRRAVGGQGKTAVVTRPVPRKDVASRGGGGAGLPEARGDHAWRGRWGHQARAPVSAMGPAPGSREAPRPPRNIIHCS